jgi:hypothetical protein
MSACFTPECFYDPCIRCLRRWCRWRGSDDYVVGSSRLMFSDEQSSALQEFKGRKEFSGLSMHGKASAFFDMLDCAENEDLRKSFEHDHPDTWASRRTHGHMSTRDCCRELAQGDVYRRVFMFPWYSLWSIRVGARVRARCRECKHQTVHEHHPTQTHHPSMRAKPLRADVLGGAKALVDVGRRRIVSGRPHADFVIR